VRTAIAIVLGLAVAASIVLLIVAPGAPPNAPVAHPAAPGKAAVHATRPPPGLPAPTGPRLTGFVVDGAGAAPPLAVHTCPLLEYAWQLHTLPSGLNRIARRGSYSS